MNAVAMGSITLLCTFLAAWLGTMVRESLPPSHLNKESQDVVRLGMGLVATMTALLLGLVTAAAKSSFDSNDAAIRASAANILTMDRHLAAYGPETAMTREVLRRAVALRIQMIGSAPGDSVIRFDDPGAVSPAEVVQNQILALEPTTEAQRWRKGQALSLCEDIVKTRWRILGGGAGAVPQAFLMIVIFWLTATFASFGLYAPRNATVLSVFLIASFSVAAAIFLILELDGPFTGVIRLSLEPLRFAFAHIGH